MRCVGGALIRCFRVSFARLEEDAGDAGVNGSLAQGVADRGERDGRRGEGDGAAAVHHLGEGAGELDEEDRALRGGERAFSEDGEETQRREESVLLRGR